MSEEAAVESAPVEASSDVEIESSESSVDLSGSEESSEASSESSDGGIEVQAETEAELEAEVQEAVAEGADVEEIKSMIRQFELKVNGKNYTKEIDLNDPEAVQKELQMALAGRHAMQQNAQMRKDWDGDIQRLREDPAGVMAELGLDPLEFAAAHIENHLKENQKSPEERAQEARMKEFEEIKAENERMKAEKEEEARARDMAAVEQELENDILSALETSTLPKTEKTMSMIADTMLWALENGYDDVSAADVLPTVQKEIEKETKALLNSLKGTKGLEDLLGEEILGGMRKDRVAQAQKVNNISNIKAKATPELKEDKPRTRRKLSDLIG